MWAVYVEEMNGDRLTLTPKRRRVLKALHAEQLTDDGNPTEAFRAILRAVRGSEFHMGKRDYQMLESLFVDQERRERWAERSRGNGTRPAEPLMMSSVEFRAREDSL